MHLHVRNFSVINQVGAASINARLDCDAFASTHSSTSHYDRARCATELRTKHRVWKALETGFQPAADFELPHDPAVLQELADTTFFRLAKVNMNAECPYWKDHEEKKCASEEPEELEVPAQEETFSLAARLPVDQRGLQAAQSVPQ